LNHPNIATIYAVEEVDGETFIVMEYIKGRELKDVIASRLVLLVNEYKIKTAQEVINIINDEVKNNAKDRPQMDDVTLVVIKRIDR
jgi:serine/threonine protein kinase